MSFAATRQVNPAGVTPVLSVEQLWAGLRRKEKEPQLFLPVIQECKVISEENGLLTREVVFAFDPSTPVRETVESHLNTIIYFEPSKGGTRVTNIVSYDAENELQLTFSFAKGIPGTPDLSGVTTQDLNEKIGGAVLSTLEGIRKMVREGSI